MSGQDPSSDYPFPILESGNKCAFCGEPIERSDPSILIHKKCSQLSEKFNLLLNAFNFLDNIEELEKFLSELPHSKCKELYDHPLLEVYDVLP